MPGEGWSGRGPEDPTLVNQVAELPPPLPAPSALPHVPSGAPQLGPGGGSAPGPCSLAARPLSLGLLPSLCFRLAVGWTVSLNFFLCPLVPLSPAPLLPTPHWPGPRPRCGWPRAGTGAPVPRQRALKMRRKIKTLSLSTPPFLIIKQETSFPHGAQGRGRPCCTGPALGSFWGWLGRGRGLRSL